MQLKYNVLHLQLQKWCERYGSIFSYQFGPTIFYVVSDVHLIHEILRRRPNDFRRIHRIEEIFCELGVHGVFSAEGESWRRQRRMVMPAFHQANLKEFFPTLSVLTGKLKNRWDAHVESGADFEVCKDLVRYTVDATTQIAFDYEMNTLEKGEDVIQKHLEEVFPAISRRLGSLVPYWRYIQFPKDRSLDLALEQVQKEILKIIDATKEQISRSFESGAPLPKNMVASFLQSQDGDGSQFSHSEVLANVFTMLLAGEDTTASSLAWVLTFMMDHPEVQERMRSEACSVIGNHELLTEYRQLDELKFIEAVILETLRLKPVASFLFMEACSDLTLGDYRFAKGEFVTALLSYPPLEEKNFSHAREFCPGRWLEEERDPGWNHDVKAFMPFGGGARVCPGRTLAMMEMKSVLAMLCRRFKVLKPQNRRKWKEEFRFTVVPVDFWIRLAR